MAKPPSQASATARSRLRHKLPPEPVVLPPGLPARIAAAAILHDVLTAGHPIDDFFAREDGHPKLAGLDQRDRALVRSIVTAALRRLGTIRRVLAGLLERGMPKKSGSFETILIATAAQILFLDVPDHAAVNLCVQAVRLDPQAQPFAALANAVARNIVREKEQVLTDESAVDVPPWLATRWRQIYGPAGLTAIAGANRIEPRLDISVKTDPAGWAERLDGDVLSTGSIRLRGSTPVPDLPGFAEGEWWVQDAAAALPARLLKNVAGERVADLCAAPGGKTAQLAQAGAQVTAVDRSAERLKRLASNIERLQLEVETQVADVVNFEAAPFDAILLDAPCSATGTVRRHPDVGWTKRPSDIPALAALQSRMLDRSIGLLKPGGRLVYCVCSIEPEEGETQIAALLRRNPDVRRDPIEASEVAGHADWLTPAGELRTLPYFNPGPDPSFAGMDGFFAVRLIRRS